jgi:hypothetical protein
MSHEKRADEETLPETPMHGAQEGRAVEEPGSAEGGPVEERAEGDPPPHPTPPAGPGDEQTTAGGRESGEGSPTTHDDTQIDEDAGEEGLGTRTGAIGGGERSEPGGHDKPR